MNPVGCSGPATVAVDGCCFVGTRTGIANYVAALLEPLCAQHRDVRFFLYCNDHQGNFPKAPNLEARISLRKRRGPIWHNTHVVDMLRQDGIDLFWGTNGIIPLRGLGQTASVLTIHDLVHVFAPQTQEITKRWKQLFFQPRCTRAADRVIAASQATADDMARHYGRVPDSVIHPLADKEFGSADAAAAADTVRRHLLPRKFILTVGTLEPRKNLAALVEAHAACIAAGYDVPPLVIVGGNGWRDA
ncbi:MAG: glycosyltransferase, partial [Caldimonas sp.]